MNDRSRRSLLSLLLLLGCKQPAPPAKATEKATPSQSSAGAAAVESAPDAAAPERQCEGTESEYACYSLMAEQTLDAAPCAKLGDELESGRCITRVAKKKLDVEPCVKIPDRLVRSWCVTEVAREKKDEATCDAISERTLRGTCISALKNGAAPPPPAPAARPRDPSAEAVIHKGITRVSGADFIVTREALKSLPAALSQSMRVVPEQRRGGIGLRLFGIRPDSLAATLGFENGDRVERINGKSIITPDEALAAYESIAKAKKITVGIDRRGAAVTLTYTVE